MSFFRTPIDPIVQKELFRRIQGVNKQYVSGELDSQSENWNNALENEYFKTCWARAAVIDDDGKSHFLNGNVEIEKQNKVTEPLNIQNGKATRGRPGITSISSTFKEFFLKQSTVSFSIPDPNDFDFIEQKFLKHGRYVLIEWGWATKKNVELESINTDNLVSLSKNISQRNRQSRGNYQALAGVITNFNYNQKPDGSYEGTFEISSMGRNILGQKIQTDGKIENMVQFINEKVELNNEAVIKKQDGKYHDSNDVATEQQIAQYEKVRKNFVNFHSTINALPNVIMNYVDGQLEGQDQNREPHLKQELGTLYDSLGAKKDGGVVGEQDTDKDKSPFISKHGAAYIPVTQDVNFKTPTDEEKPLTYCSWGWFEDHILNSFFSFNSSVTEDDFRTKFFSVNHHPDYKNGSGISTKCQSNPNLFSLGLQSIILPGKFPTFTAGTGGIKEVESHTEPGKAPFMNWFKDFSWSTGLKEDPSNESGTNQKATKREHYLLEIINGFRRYFEPFETKDNVSGRYLGNIRHFVFEANYLMDSFVGVTNIDQALMNFWQKVSGDYGHFWTFAVMQDEDEDGKIKIVDLNVGMIKDTEVVPNPQADKAGKLSEKDKYLNWRLDLGPKHDHKSSPDPKQIFEFPLYEKNSIIQDFSIETAYDSEMATMAVFGSNADVQATRGDMGQGYVELAVRAISLLNNPDTIDSDQESSAKYNKLLKNISTPYLTNGGVGASSKHIFKVTPNPGQDGGQTSGGTPSWAATAAYEANRYSGTAEDDDCIVQQKTGGGINFGQIPEIQQYEKQIEEDVEESLQAKEGKIDVGTNTKEFIRELRKGYFWFDTLNGVTQIYSSYSGQMLNEIKRTMLYKINKSADEDDKSNYNVVLPAVPLQLSLTLQGIGGIKIGDLFYIRYLPEMYRKYCHFMVVNVAHEVSTTGWTTKLESRMIVDIPTLVGDNPSKFTKTVLKPYLIGPEEQLVDKLQQMRDDYVERWSIARPDAARDYMEGGPNRLGTVDIYSGPMDF